MKHVAIDIVGPVAYLTLNNPTKHNAFNDEIIVMLRSAIDSITQNNGIRALVLKAEGQNFCAGADLSWMKSMAAMTYEENLADARKLASLMKELNEVEIPTLALVQGAAYGGAIGLIACCDIVLCTDDARFCLSEAKLGLAPATIGPYVAKAIGTRIAKKLFLTAEVFTAEHALDYQLVHQICHSSELEERANSVISNILKTGPQASIACKQLIDTINASPTDLIEQTSQLIARLRVSEEGQAGLSAFFEKKSPDWAIELPKID